LGCCRKKSYQIAKGWRKHVLAAIRMHHPDEVAEDGHNVIYPSRDNLKKLKAEKMPLWTVEGFVGKYLQTDEYTCAALAINRFAKILRELSNGTILGDGIDDFLVFKDTSDENVANAKSLLLQLMEKRFNCFELITDGGHVWDKNKVVVPKTEETDEKKSQDEVTKEKNKLEEGNEKTDTLKYIQDSPRMEKNAKKNKKIPI
jgi:hypothetical protein